MNKTLKLTGIIGLLAAVLMFTGDMLLYYSSRTFTDIEKELLPSMADVPALRLTIGGLLGPITACLYLVGYYHIYCMVKDNAKTWGKLMLLLLSVAIIIGGAFHAIFPAFGLVASHGHSELIDPILRYAQVLGTPTFVGTLSAWLLFAVLLFTKRTHYHWSIFFASPCFTYGFIALWTKILPDPLRVIIAGGWNNIVMIIFFVCSLLMSTHLSRGTSLPSRAE